MDWNSRVTEFEEKGSSIIKFDFSRLHGDDVVEMANYALSYALTKNRSDLLFLYDATDAKLSSQVIQRLKFITKNYGCVRKKSAVLGISGVRKVFFNGLMMYTENKMRAFNSHDVALEYLTSD